MLVNTRLAAPEIASIVESSKPKFFLFDPPRRQNVLEATKRAADLTLVASASTPEDDLTIADLIETGATTRPPPLPAGVEDFLHFYTSGTTGAPKGVARTHGSFHVQHGYLNPMQWGLVPGTASSRSRRSRSAPASRGSVTRSASAARW